MLPTPLIPDDLREIARACAAFRMPHRPLPWMQGFLVARLALRNSAMSRRIDQMDLCQVDRLCHHVRELQAIGRWQVDGTRASDDTGHRSKSTSSD
jgi:hypothetical protein